MNCSCRAASGEVIAPRRGSGGVESVSEPDQPRQETEALRERLSRLSAAILRTSASLNVGTVLHEVVESARALTGARYGVITTIDAVGELQDFRHLRLHGGRAPAARSLARRAAAVRAIRTHQPWAELAKADYR